MRYLALLLVVGYLGCAGPIYSTLPSDGLIQVWWSDKRATISPHPEVIEVIKILKKTGPGR